MGIHAPISVSVKDGDMNNLFYRIVNAAEQPHVGVPETEIGKYKKRNRQIVNNSLVFVSGSIILCFAMSYFINPYMHVKLKGLISTDLYLYRSCYHKVY